jgi:hypothetical protein
MHLSIERLDAADAVWAGQPLPPPEPRRTLRGEHAHFLEIAAARRKRAMDRAALNRLEDADYWKQVAPAALERAARLREHPSFSPLP